MSDSCPHDSFGIAYRIFPQRQDQVLDSKLILHFSATCDLCKGKFLFPHMMRLAENESISRPWPPFSVDDREIFVAALECEHDCVGADVVSTKAEMLTFKADQDPNDKRVLVIGFKCSTCNKLYEFPDFKEIQKGESHPIPWDAFKRDSCAWLIVQHIDGYVPDSLELDFQGAFKGRPLEKDMVLQIFDTINVYWQGSCLLRLPGRVSCAGLTEHQLLPVLSHVRRLPCVVVKLVVEEGVPTFLLEPSHS